MNLSDVNLIDPSTLYILCIPDFVVLRIYCAFQKFVTTCCGVNDSVQSVGQSPFFSTELEKQGRSAIDSLEKSSIAVAKSWNAS